MNRNRKIIIGLVSLVGVLAYNWTHTGGLLASYVRPEFVGYVAAAGIELAVVGLSLRIDELRRANNAATFHLATLGAVVIVSAIANVAQGYLVKFGQELTSTNIVRLDAVQVVVSLSATGLLSLVVFALAEVVGHDIGATGTQPARNTDATPTQPAQVETQAIVKPKSDAIGVVIPVLTDGLSEDATQSRQNATLSDLDTENVHDIDKPENGEITVIWKNSADVIVDFYRSNPAASMKQAAQHVAQVMGKPYTRQAVSAQLARPEVAERIAGIAQ